MVSRHHRIKSKQYEEISSRWLRNEVLQRKKTEEGVSKAIAGEGIFRGNHGTQNGFETLNQSILFHERASSSSFDFPWLFICLCSVKEKTMFSNLYDRAWSLANGSDLSNLYVLLWAYKHSICTLQIFYFSITTVQICWRGRFQSNHCVCLKFNLIDTYALLYAHSTFFNLVRVCFKKIK